MKNPFTLMYGIASGSTIARGKEEERILNSFLNDEYMYAYFISGIRGSGKTVLLRGISQKLSALDSWIVVDLNSCGNLLVSLSSKLKETQKGSKLLEGWSISLSFSGITLTKEKGASTSDPEIIAQEILTRLQSKKIKVLVTIDEVNDTEEFKRFIHFYQSMAGNAHPFYLLMTGLNENINDIINDKAMTFLSRSPRVTLSPLDLPSIASAYMGTIGCEKEEAIKMAKLTNGYAFAYQVLGYFCFEQGKKKLDKQLTQIYTSYLWSSGYAKFWNDSSKKEKEFLIALAHSANGQKSEIISFGNLAQASFSQYRRRLLERGMLLSPEYGKLSFALPTFKDYVLYQEQFQE